MRTTLFFYLITSFFLNQKAFSQSDLPPILLEHPDSIAIVSLDILNSESKETNISISPDGNLLFFMSTKGGQEWSVLSGEYKGQARYDGDIYFSHRKDSAQNWNPPKNISSINTSSGEDEPSINMSGQKVVFQSWKRGWVQSGGPYYSANLLMGDNWTNIVGLGGGITQFFKNKFSKHRGYATDGMSLSPDFKTFVVATGSDYGGNMDLYWSRRDSSGIWSYCKKMPVSTAKDERSVFFAPDSRTIYFASDGYGGFGGLDIFKATLDNEGNVTALWNIGEPFNTPQDDYGFVLTASGEAAYFIRDGNIHYADTKRANPVLKPSPVLLLNGMISSCKASLIEVRLVNSVGNIIGTNSIYLSSQNTNKNQFKFLITESLKETQIYQLELWEKEQMVRTVPVSVAPFQKYEEQKVSSLRLDNCQEKSLTIHFAFDSDTVSSTEKEKLQQFIKKNSGFEKVILSGHTDSFGTNNYNQVLSSRRIRNVISILQSLKVEKDIITEAPQGEQQPAQSNETSFGRAKNRRVVIELN